MCMDKQLDVSHYMYMYIRTHTHTHTHTGTDIWNGLDKEVVEAVSVHNFKVKLDKNKYRDRTA